MAAKKIISYIGMYVAMSSSLLMLHKDFLMAEFKFMQVKTTFDNKLNYLELINAALEQWPLLNCSLLFQQNEHLVAAAPDQAYTVINENCFCCQ